VHPGGLVTTLALVVALPFAVGLAAGAGLDRATKDARAGRARCPGRVARHATAVARELRRRAGAAATVLVAALVALVASEVHLDRRYLALTGALLAFLAASAGLGGLLARRLPPATGRAVLLTTSMRDFAVAAALAAAAWGPKAAAPLGVYGVLVLLWGTGAAGWLRSRPVGRRPRPTAEPAA
jgi:predicted Na+-dependent transporter